MAGGRAKSGPVKSENVEAMLEPHLMCRLAHLFDYQHDFDIQTLRGSISQWKRLYVCLRCGAEKTETIDGTTFKVFRAKIVYPDYYLSSGGRITKSDVRRQQMSRLGHSVRKITGGS